MTTQSCRREFLGALSAFSLFSPDQEEPPEAIRVGTIHGAYASYEEPLKGSLEVGKVAHLVLGRDPIRVDPSTLVTIPVERTMAGGRCTYES